MTALSKKIKTWRERIGQTEEFTLHLATDVERAMVAEIAELRSASAAANWISVRERMPEDSLIKFLVTGIARAGGPLGVHMAELRGGSLYFHESDLKGGCDPCIDDVVTYWMPLPAAPTQISQAEALNFGGQT